MTLALFAPLGRRFAIALVAALALGAAGGLLAGTAPDGGHRHLVVDGVPLDEVHPPGAAASGRRSGVVVAHGYAGSARLMAPFADTLSSAGYVVVLLDFTGHGANPHRWPNGSADRANAALQQDLDLAVTYLRGLPDVDPARVSLVGHSMGAGAVTRYALNHPDITATAAISLPDASFVPPDRPDRLLLLVGGLEFAGFRAAAEHTVTPGHRERSVVVVPGVEHLSVLYAPRTHREIVSWLNDSAGEPVSATPLPSPLRRPSAAALLMLSLLAGLYPLAHLLLGDLDPPRSWPRVVRPQIGRLAVVAAIAAVVGMLVAPISPTIRLPLALGNFVVGFVAVAGAVMLAYHLRSTAPAARNSDPAAAETIRPSRLRLAIAAPLLFTYAAVTIALPLQLGLTQAIPVGARWWLLASLWAGFAVLALAAEQIADGNSFGVLAVSMVTVTALTGAAIIGLTSSFVLLVAPLLAVLLVFQAIWSAVLHRFSVPAGLIAPVGSLLVAWPLAIALPVTG